MRERALPAGVRGPVLLVALRLFAAICLSEAIYPSVVLALTPFAATVPASLHGRPCASQCLFEEFLNHMNHL